MRKYCIAALVVVMLGGIGQAVFAVCSAMRASSYTQARPTFMFYAGTSQAEISAARRAEIMAARQRAEALRRQKMETRIGNLKSFEEQSRVRATEKRRDNLEAQFSRAYESSPEVREAKAKEFYQRGQSAERNNLIDAARDYYLFAVQLAPGTQVASDAHAALLRLDEKEGKGENFARGQDPAASLLSQRDLEEIKERLGDWFAEAELVQQMLQQLASDQDERKQLLVIERLRDAKGTAYTEGLVQALRIVRGEVQQAAREALIDRMTRMTPATLRDKLGSDQDELRLAAIQAAGDKKAQDLVPDLIELVTEKNSAVRSAAGKALQTITGKDFGPAPNASFEEQFYARKQWQAWWDANGGTKGR
jgi:hypothetical protein